MSHPYEDLATQILRQGALGGTGTQPVALTQIEVNGGDSFSREFFAKLLAPLADQSDYTLAQLMHQTEHSCDNIRKTLVFRRIRPSFHVDYLHAVPDVKTYNKDKAIPTRVVFDLEAGELSSAQAALGFNTQDNLVVDLGYANHNFNHNAELVKIGVNYRPYKPSEQLVSTMRLVLNLRNPAYKFVVDLNSAHRNNQLWQQNLTKTSGGAIGVAFANAANTLLVFSGLALAKRLVYDDPESEFGGDFLKSSIVNRVAYSSVRHLGNAAFPRSGVAAAFANEISSDQEQEHTSDKLAFFVKSTGKVDLYHSCGANTFTAHVFGEAGAIYAAKSNSFGLHLTDRFYLGGVNSLSGFARNCVNPAGGAQFYKAGVALYSRIPSFVHLAAAEKSPLRLYATSVVANVGDNVLADRGVTSAGVGIRYFNEWVKLDAGYFVALRHDSGRAGIRDGFQLELSLGGTTSSE